MESAAETNASDGSDGTLTRGGYYATGVYVMTVGIIATVGNFMVILVIVKNWSSYNMIRKPHLPLTLSLAISDLGITFFGYPYTSISGFSGRWVFNDRVCTMAGFFCFFLSMASLDVLTAISVYRYIAICRPELKVRLTKCATTMAILFCWAYALVWTVPPLFGVSGYTYEPFKTACSMDWASRKTVDIVFLVGTDIFCFLVHLIILTFCYTKIFKRYRHLTSPSEGIVGNRDLNREMKVTWMTFSNVVIFVIVWSPYAVVCTWMVFSDSFPAKASVLPTLFAKSSCAFNPILYGAFDKKFRQLAKRVVCPCLFKVVHPTSKTGGYTAKRPKHATMFSVTPIDMMKDETVHDQSNNGDEKLPHSGPQAESSSVIIVKANIENDSVCLTVGTSQQHQLCLPTASPMSRPKIVAVAEQHDGGQEKSYLMSGAFRQDNKSLVKSRPVAHPQSPAKKCPAGNGFSNCVASDRSPVGKRLTKEPSQASRQLSFVRGSTEEKYAVKYEPSSEPFDVPTGHSIEEPFPLTDIASSALPQRSQRQIKCDLKKITPTNQIEMLKQATKDPVLTKSERNFGQSLLETVTIRVSPERVYRYSYNMYNMNDLPRMPALPEHQHCKLAANLMDKSMVNVAEHPDDDPYKSYLMLGTLRQDNKIHVKSHPVAQSPVKECPAVKEFSNCASDRSQARKRLTKEPDEAARHRSFSRSSKEGKYEPSSESFDVRTSQRTEETVPVTGPSSTQTFQRETKCDSKKSTPSNQPGMLKRATMNSVLDKAERNFGQSFLGRRLIHVSPESVYRYSYNMYNKK